MAEKQIVEGHATSLIFHDAIKDAISKLKPRKESDFVRAEVTKIEVMKGGITNLAELIITLREK